MPLPKTKDMGKMMEFMNKEHPEMSMKQKVAIALKKTGKGKLSKMAMKARGKMPMKY